jgi:hypothetical protein
MTQLAPPQRREALLKEYGEGLSNFRLLTEIRFKLLALLPVAAAAAAILRVAVAGDPSAVTAAGTFAISTFGLVVTLAVVAYNHRNDQLYSALVDRAVQIERELGLFDGYFATRPQDWATVRVLRWRRGIGHRGAVGTIYAASASLWLFGAILSLLQLRWRALGERSSHGIDAALVGIALVAAVTATVAGVRALSNQLKEREGAMRELARVAVDAALREGVPNASGKSDFDNACAGLLEDVVRCPPESIRESIGALKVADVRGLEAAIKRVHTRAAFYRKLTPEERRVYMPREPPEAEAAYFVGLITDLVPQWVLDSHTRRRE